MPLPCRPFLRIARTELRSHARFLSTSNVTADSDSIHGVYISTTKPLDTNPSGSIAPRAWPSKGEGRRLEAPVAVKDNFVTLDNLPTTCGSGILQNHQSPFEAYVVKQIKGYRSSNDTEALYSVDGKSNMDEFGMGSHSLNSFFGHVSGTIGDRSVGGSSGGSAMAVAAGLSEVALGTDTGGSIRLPAAYTGTIGFKPSYGLASRWGVIPYANSLDTVGTLSSNLTWPYKFIEMHHCTLLREPRHTKSPESDPYDRTMPPTKTYLHALAHSSPNIRLSNITVGVPVECNIEELDPAVRQAWTDSLALLIKQGCRVVPISLPNTKHALSAYYVLAPAEAASNLSKYDGVRYGTRNDTVDGGGDVLYSKTRGDGFGVEVKRRILLGSYTLSSTAIDNYFIKAQKVRRLVQRDFDRVFSLPNPLRNPEQFDLSDMDESVLLDNKLGPSQVDIIICPTAPTLPPTIKEVRQQSTVDTYMNDVFTVPASLAGLPAISIPTPVPEKYRLPGTPKFAGLQIIGQYGDDVRVVRVAQLLHIKLHEHTADKNATDIRNTEDTAYFSLSKRLVDSTVTVKTTEDLHNHAIQLSASAKSLLRNGAASCEPRVDLRKTKPSQPVETLEDNQLGKLLTQWSLVEANTRSSTSEKFEPQEAEDNNAQMLTSKSS